MIEVYGLRLNEDFNKLRDDRLIKCLPEDKRERAMRFHRHEDANRTLFADILIRYIINKKIKTSFKQISFEKNEYGKPFLKDNPDVHFNISHSGEWVVAALNKFPVGIDVELVKPMDFGIAERFFSKDEYKQLIDTAFEKRLDYFYELWTLKESYIKALGRGLSIPLDSFSIYVSSGKIDIRTDNNLQNYFFKQYKIDDRYKMAVCGLSDKFPDKVEVFDFKTFYSEICCLYGV